MRTIRKAGESDLDQLLDWATRFHAGSNWADEPFSASRVRETFAGMIAGDSTIILMHDEGMIGGAISPIWITDRRTVAQECFWYAERDGGQLAKALEEWARQMGAAWLVMSGLKDDSGRIQRLYARKGFEQVEYHYRKRL